MAAAVELSRSDVQVTVFEAASMLGGRARAVEYRGLKLDNGAHIMAGAYRQTLELMRKVGVHESSGHFVREPLDLHFPGLFRLRAARLPRPLHLAAGLLTCRGLPLAQRIGAARFMHTARRTGFALDTDISVDALLTRSGQGAHVRRFLWEPLCLAALNTRPQDASAQVFLNVLRDSLNGTRCDSELLLPRCDLSALFPAPAAAFVGARGGHVRMGCSVRAVQGHAAGFEIEHTRGNEHYDAVVCALPPYRVAEVLAPLPLPHGLLADIDALEHEPIFAVYLQYDEGAGLPQAMVGLDGGLAQWAFDRGRLQGQAGLICAVISARGPHQQLTHEQLAERVAHQLRARFARLRTPQWTKVIAEKRATFSCRARLQRPDQATPLPRLVLAGDYTASPYPGTLEAATRSGVRCARLLMEALHVHHVHP
ncbi:MAG: hydroxysqualene dehydroxylase HpnE [Burkholderiales bacterium]|nr:hydroxysqualene dehydroxylase HpnE [Burkholderiales bacterium]